MLELSPEFLFLHFLSTKKMGWKAAVQMLRRWIYSLYLEEEGHLFTSDSLSLVTF